MSDGKSIYFEWNESYRTGYAEVDIQHQKLFELGNALFLSDHSEARKYLMELYKYTRCHFESEEAIMLELHATNLVEHRKIHDDLLEQLNCISDDYLSDPTQFEQLKVFVYQWVTQHILNEDLATWAKFTT